MATTQSDYVELRDVASWLIDGDGSGGGGRGGGRQRQRRLCSSPPTGGATAGRRGAPVRLLTDSASFTMVFHSNNVYDGTGFTADYEFRRRQGAGLSICS